MTIRCLIPACTLALLIPLWSTAAEAGSAVYVAGFGNEFGTIDLTTGAFTQIGTLALPANDAIFGMGFGSDGNLYGLDLQSDAHLWRIDVSNANVTDLGAIGQNDIGAGADAAGTLYGLNQSASSVFFGLNPPSTSTNVINGATNVSGDGLVAPSPDGTQVFAAVSSGSGELLVSINPTTGVVTTLGSTGFSLYAGVFVDGTLYGFDGSNDAIVTLNTSTGAGTQVATYSLPNGDPIDAAATFLGQSVPEPSSVVMSLIAAAAGGSVGLLRRRRSTAKS